MDTVIVYSIAFLLASYAGLSVQLSRIYAAVSLFGACLFLAAAFIVRKNKIFAACMCCCFLLLGTANGIRIGKSAAEELHGYFGSMITAQGHAIGESLRVGEHGVSFLLECEGIEIQGKSVPYTGKLQVYAPGERAVRCSGKVTVQGELNAAVGFRNWGGFDTVKANRIRKIGGVVKKGVIICSEEFFSLRDRFAAFNRRLRAEINSIVPGRAGSVMQGLALGGTRGMDEEIRENFASAGIAHMLSVSGTHMILLTSFATFIFSYLPEYGRNLLIIILLTCYAVLCDLRPPVIRALCMSVILIMGRSGAVRGRLLFAVAVGMSLLNPLWLLDISFQLSFGAALGIIYLQPKIKNITAEYLPDVISDGAAVTLAAQAAVLPLEVFVFHQLPLLSVLSNLLLVPVLEAVLILTILGSLAVICLDAGGWLLVAAGFFTEQILVWSSRLARLPIAVVPVGALPLWTACLYYSLLLLWLDAGWSKLLTGRERRLAGLFTFAGLCAVLSWQQLKPQPLTMYMLDVGQGDACVVMTPDKKIILVDTGGLSNFDTGSRIIAPFLRYLGRDTVDLLLLSHYDHDHIGGAAGLGRSTVIKKVLLPKELCGREGAVTVSKLLEKLPEENFFTAAAGDVYDFSEVELRIIDVPDKNISGNEASTLAEITDKRHGYRILFTGDMGTEREDALDRLGRYHVLKVGHHGSRNSSSEAFLRRVSPQLALISAGVGNKYGHPHEETLGRLEEAGAQVLRTDQSGCIKMEFREDGIFYSTFAEL